MNQSQDWNKAWNRNEQNPVSVVFEWNQDQEEVECPGEIKADGVSVCSGFCNKVPQTSV
jgi:hypothetical protein